MFHNLFMAMTFPPYSPHFASLIPNQTVATAVYTNFTHESEDSWGDFWGTYREHMLRNLTFDYVTTLLEIHHKKLTKKMVNNLVICDPFV